MLVTADDKATDVRRGLLHDQKESDEVAEQTPNKGTIEHSNHDHSHHEMPVSLTTNRVKAVIFINIHALLLFGSSASLKYALNQKGVSALDASMIRTLVLIMSTAAVVFLNGASFRIAKQDRWLVILRSLLGAASDLASSLQANQHSRNLPVTSIHTGLQDSTQLVSKLSGTGSPLAQIDQVLDSKVLLRKGIYDKVAS